MDLLHDERQSRVKFGKLCERSWTRIDINKTESTEEQPKFLNKHLKVVSDLQCSQTAE